MLFSKYLFCVHATRCYNLPIFFLTLNLGFFLIALQQIRLSQALHNSKSNCTVVALLKDYHVQLLVEVLVTAHTKMIF